MSGLGSVFDAVATGEDVPRGPDLAVTVQVPRSALGRPEGWRVDVPPVLSDGGALVPRAIDPHAREAGIRLHLAPTLPARATLRLRGQGGVHARGAPGDLLVTIDVVDDPPWPSLRARIAIVVAIVAAASTLAWATLGG